MSYNIVLKKCTSPVNKLTKSFASGTASFDVVLKENTDVFRPTFLLQTNDDKLWNYNYIDGSSFSGRMYFITDVRSVGHNRFEVDAKTDVLSTWKDEIENLTAVINKQEGLVPSNKYLNDGSFVSQVNEFNTSYNFANGFNSSGKFILICAGG